MLFYCHQARALELKIDSSAFTTDVEDHEDDDCEHDYCSCYTIDNAEIDAVDVAAVAQALTTALLCQREHARHNDPAVSEQDGFDKDWYINKDLQSGDIHCRTRADELVHYAIDRILRLYGADNPAHWTMNWESDYYGDVLTHADWTGTPELLEQLAALRGLNNNDMIQYALRAEHEALRGQRFLFRLTGVELSRLTFPDAERAAHAQQGCGYEREHFVVAIAQPNADGTLTVLDGYRRAHTALQHLGLTEVPVLLAEPAS